MSKIFIIICLFCAKNVFALNYQDFLEVKYALEQGFEELKPSSEHELIINMPVGDNDYYWWNLDTVSASYSGLEINDTVRHHVFIFGGYIRADFMTKDLLANTGCHEIAHGLGGAPYKSSGSSMEPQADYWATKVCLPVVFKYLKSSSFSLDPYPKLLCDQYAENKNLCYRLMNAISPERDFFYQDDGSYVSFEEVSHLKAYELNLDPTYYPESQCRFDSMIHGVLKLKRPHCWYPEGIERIIINGKIY